MFPDPLSDNISVLSRFLDSDELTPQEGKDEEYDTVLTEIRSLEKELANELKVLRKSTGRVCLPQSMCAWR